MDDWTEVSWPVADLGDALGGLAAVVGWPVAAEVPMPPVALTADNCGDWLDGAVERLGLEVEAVETTYGDRTRWVTTAGPALLRLPGSERFVALVGRRRGRVAVYGPDRRVHRLPVAALVDALGQKAEAEWDARFATLLDRTGVSTRRREQVRRSLLAGQLRARRLQPGWLVRLPPGAEIGLQARVGRLPQRVAGLAAVHLLQYGLWLLSWWLVGKGALEGHFAGGWLWAWWLLLLSLVPLRAWTTWAAGRLALDAGALFKERLLHGALQLDPDHSRRWGAGQLMGRVLEAEAVESLALSGGFLGLVAVLELLVAGGVLALGAGGALHALCLVGWVVVLAIMGWRYVGGRGAWTEARLAMTHDLVERMVGHRTRLAQEAPAQWHRGEDEAAVDYLRHAQRLDRAAALLLGLGPRGWLVVGLLGLGPALVGGGQGATTLALSAGGVLLAFRALEKGVAGLADLAGALIAWRQVAPLWRAGERAAPPGRPELAVQGSDERTALVDARDLGFSYADRAEPVLRGCQLRIAVGDRLLLEGDSGGGKSTLAALLSGLRTPDRGLLLLGGADRASLGAAGWRRRVVAAVQFHENHILAETLAFNLLMGRSWPPGPKELGEADVLCRELGLGPLLDRMPGGLMQRVGDTGWQLSHGERSRVFVARTLLQGAELVILDESFAALDPETFQQVLACVERRAPTLMVIAHP